MHTRLTTSTSGPTTSPGYPRRLAPRASPTIPTALAAPPTLLASRARPPLPRPTSCPCSPAHLPRPSCRPSPHHRRPTPLLLLAATLAPLTPAANRLAHAHSHPGGGPAEHPPTLTTAQLPLCLHLPWPPRRPRTIWHLDPDPPRLPICSRRHVQMGPLLHPPMAQSTPPTTRPGAPPTTHTSQRTFAGPRAPRPSPLLARCPPASSASARKQPQPRRAQSTRPSSPFTALTHSSSTGSSSSSSATLPVWRPTAAFPFGLHLTTTSTASRLPRVTLMPRCRPAQRSLERPFPAPRASRSPAPSGAAGARRAMEMRPA